MNATSCFEEKGTGACFCILLDTIADCAEDGFVGWRLRGVSPANLREHVSFSGVIVYLFKN